jgi:hypothetical protein
LAFENFANSGTKRISLAYFSSTFFFFKEESSDDNDLQLLVKPTVQRTIEFKSFFILKKIFVFL